MKSKECVMCHGLAFYCPYCGIDKRAPSPKPCAGCANKAVEEYLKDSSYLVPKLNIPHTCHQPKPEVSPEKKEKCEDSQCFDANCSTHGIHPTPPAKEEKEVCTCASFFTVRGTHKKDCPTPTEQKGEWEEEFDKKFPALWHELGHDDLILKTDEVKSFIAAKKKEWEAQKEQAVKAEIREIVKNKRKLVWNWQKETKELDAFNQAIDEILSLLSDKVTH